MKVVMAKNKMPKRKKKVDDDEDRSNPQYIPKKGTFYEHDDRTVEDLDAEVEEIKDDGTDELSSGTGKEKEKKDGRITKKWQASQDRWTHDRFDECDQAPKSRNELVSSYGYDIRNEDGPPRARRRRRYGRGPSKYTRNWEDESAYAKQTSIQKKPRPEDFPALGTERRSENMHMTKPRRRERQSSSEYKENNDRNIERNVQSSQRQSFKEYKTANRRSGPKTNDRRGPDQREERNNSNRNSVGNSGGGSNFRQQHNNPADYMNQTRNRANDQASREQRYDNRQNYEQQEMNYNRARYQQSQQQSQQPQQQQQTQHQQAQIDDERRYQKNSSERDVRTCIR